ncbi:hypothetical protein PR202_ga18863 [Eleusine coracana subsp. coracana]|uniref:Uncharacterized protein n=1 Tax=Eleusine coracana subsp. coracana TaxID=191504 RepID=A0AAV5CTV4_ELECO|nr:hypothetical protein PR202_ga18863 [Eleusine coracana subsp. coracana]
MADAVVEAHRRTRPASLDEADDGAIIKKPILTLASPSPSRHALDPRPPRRRGPARRSRALRVFDSMCRSLPLFNPSCGLRHHHRPAADPPRHSDSLLSHLASLPHPPPSGGLGSSSRRLTGTLFGYRNCRVSLALQDTARCLPHLVVELAVPTHALLRELSAMGGARVVLETEKRADDHNHNHNHNHNHGEQQEQEHDDDAWVLEEATWTMFCGGKRVGYAVRREPTALDVQVLETLWAVSMGGGVLPAVADVDWPDGEMAYLRGSFEHTVGSRDSESLYMVGPPGGDCPELAIFFVRI